MEATIQIILAGLLTCLLTFCDLDSVFDAPPTNLSWREWWRLHLWRWGFILGNGSLSSLLYYVLNDKEYLKEMNPWLASIVVGASYMAIVRMKITTLPNNTPVGLDTLYEAVRGVVHRRINDVVRDWRSREAERLAKTDLEILRQQALLKNGSDAILTEDARRTTSAWVNQVAADKKTPENDRRVTLALYLISGRQTTP